MTCPIPYRIFYSVAEVAQLVGCTRQFIYDAVRDGEREEPPDDAILPDKVMRLGAKLCIHRSFIFGDEPDNVVPFPQPELSDATIQRIADAVAERLATGLMGRVG